jgi:hypothetical protein
MAINTLIEPKQNEEGIITVSGPGVFFTRQDAGLLPAKPDSGNYLAFYCRLLKTFTPTITDAVFCLSRRQSPSTP